MAAKNNIKKDIKDATDALRELMVESLSGIAQAMVDQVIANLKSLPDSKRFDAIKGVTAQGVNDYYDRLRNAFGVISADAFEKVRREVPKKKNVRLAEIDEESIKLGEFDSLPPDTRSRILSQLQLLKGTQIADLEKAVYFQFQSSVDSTDSLDQIQADLEEAAGEYVDGNSVRGAASANASSIINESRLAFFLDDSVQEEIDAFEFVNGDPVSPICQDLAGTVFAKDDPNLNRYWPPLHFNCKSWISAILKGNLGNREITDLKPSSAKIEASIQFSEGMLNEQLSEIKNPRPGNLQTIIISKEKAKTLEQAKAIAKEVGAEHLEADETDSSFRFRQRNPSDFVEGAYHSKSIPQKGATLVYGQIKA